MGELINLNAKPRVIELGNRKERIEKRDKQLREEFEKLKNKRKKR